MNDMLKDWTFWKPIVLWVGTIGGYFTVLALLPKWYAVALSVTVMGVFSLGMLYFLGKSYYDLKQMQIKNNYRKLTGKEYDE